MKVKLKRIVGMKHIGRNKKHTMYHSIGEEMTCGLDGFTLTCDTCSSNNVYIECTDDSGTPSVVTGFEVVCIDCNNHTQEYG